MSERQSELSWRREWLLLAVVLVVLATDQLSKVWIKANLYPGQSIPRDGPFRLTYVTNTGAAFGLLQEQSLLLTLVAALVVGVILVYYRYLLLDGLLLRMSLGLQLGGALGNLADRLRYGYVVDFLDFRFWPVFNLADSAIVVGVGILAYLFLLSPDKGKRGRKA